MILGDWLFPTLAFFFVFFWNFAKEIKRNGNRVKWIKCFLISIFMALAWSISVLFLQLLYDKYKTPGITSYVHTYISSPYAYSFTLEKPLHASSAPQPVNAANSILDEKTLLAILALTFSVIGGIAIKTARDAVNDARNAVETILKVMKYDEKLEEFDFKSLRTNCLADLSVRLSEAIATRNQQKIDAFSHSREIFEAANIIEESDFNSEILKDKLELLEKFNVSHRHLSQSDHDFLLLLGARLRKNDYKELADSAARLAKSVNEARSAR